MGVENETTTYGAQNIYTLSDDVTITHGKHAFKFGTLLNRWNEGTQSNNGFNGMLRYSVSLNSWPAHPAWLNTNLGRERESDYIYDTLGLLRTGRLAHQLTVDLKFGIPNTNS